MTTENNKPEKKFRATPVCATVWLNQGQTKDGKLAQYRTISLDRTYKDKEGEFKQTNSFRVNDLPKAKLVLDEAYKYIVLKDGSSDNPAVPEEEEVIM